jgi:hypothetical protein
MTGQDHQWLGCEAQPAATRQKFRWRLRSLPPSSEAQLFAGDVYEELKISQKIY